jgi:C-terminal processing protease CtpA/Prc
MKIKFPIKLLLATLFALFFIPAGFGQAIDRIERDRMKEMLSNLKNAIKKNYYDPAYHGIDLDARFKTADEKLDKVTSVGQAYAVIAQVLVDFNDSHLYFLPPVTTADVEYGFRMKMVGDKAFVTSVKPKSDAEAKGLKAGDLIVSFEGFRPNRKELWKLQYYYYTLSPRASLRLEVLHPGADVSTEIAFAAKIKTKNRTLDLTNHFDVNEVRREMDNAASNAAHYFFKAGDTVIWKMMTFAVEPTQIDQIMSNEVKKGRNLILDLRGNGGGYVKTFEELSGFLFDKDLKIGDRKGREEKKKENQPIMLKSRGKDVFSGKLVVLIDHQSGSASELFARLVQIEKRGVVLGDTSAGAVMQSISYPFKMIAGINKEIYYGASITNADVIMSDGKSIEHVGVTPDEIILPTAQDISMRRDPVLSRAVEILGGKLSPETAGKMFAKADEWDDH